jgi:serine phosphatase RsbU (regulator of sigma subunit)
MRLVANLVSAMGVEPAPGGKTVWAEVNPDSARRSSWIESDTDVLAQWEDADHAKRSFRFRVELGEVPTELLLAAKSHVDNLVREFTLAASGAMSGMSADVVPHLASLVEVVVSRFAGARDSIKRQALAAAASGRLHTALELELDAEAADAGLEYLEALDAIDTYCRAARLLTLESPPQHRVFRHWYVEELVDQVRSLSAGEQPRPVQRFEDRLIQEMVEVAAAQKASERSARLYTVAGALVAADSPESVAEAVLVQGVAALGASGGGLLLASDADRLLVPGTVGYDQDVVSRLREESKNAELPAAVALRTAEPVWIESRAERDAFFPELVSLEPATVSACAVPLLIRGRCLGALRFSFNEPRLFDEDERRFVLALAAQSAQALARSQLQQARIDASTRLQRSLLPPRLPAIPGLETAAVYHPFGDGMEVGGDFYDLWKVGDSYGLSIGDVVGTGPEAAAVTALVRYFLRALTLHSIDPVAVLAELNQGLLAAAAEREAEEIFCTAIVGALAAEPRGWRLALASGGHPYPLLCRAGGHIEEVEVPGLLLGAFEPLPLAVREVVLEPGDLIVLYTDGVLEARSPSGEMFGTEGVRLVLESGPASAEKLADALERAVVDHVGGELVDDLAALVVKATGPVGPSGPVGS